MVTLEFLSASNPIIFIRKIEGGQTALVISQFSVKLFCHRFCIQSVEHVIRPEMWHARCQGH